MSLERPVRVRFAPSPTGALHIGGVRTALFNYLFAKQRGGTFILRIEDTDTKRFVPEAEQYIIDSLQWLGISPDEGVEADGKIVVTPTAKHPHAPYKQSCRKELYKSYADALVNKGHAYYAFDTAKEIEEKRQSFAATGRTFSYNAGTRMEMRNSVTLTEQETKALLNTSSDWVIRFKTPGNQILTTEDLIRGTIQVNTDTLDDKVLWKKTDGLPTYHLANIVDDYLMDITHVIRGEEWLPSLPLHILLYKAFDWNDKKPEFAHLPLILKPDGNGKLSKRDGDRLGFPVFPLRWESEGVNIPGFKEKGYLPEALLNFLALLGWNSGTEQEIFTKTELTTLFSIEKIAKAGAKFNIEKALWFNQQYLKTKNHSDLVTLLTNQLQEQGIDNQNVSKDKVITLFRERFVLLPDIVNMTKFCFVPPVFSDTEESYPRSIQNHETFNLLSEFRLFCNQSNWDNAGDIKTAITQWLNEKQTKPQFLMKPLRYALVGAFTGPDIFDIIALLGLHETTNRLSTFIDLIKPA